ncbi:MAG: HEPN domain-containing protein [Treponema sp.]|jgi:HEPN domain-containing protein|nr:HEPN domain-containing protein [Treponema sp.]
MSDKIVKEWLRYAQNDLIVAKHCFEDLHPKQTEIASYHCQQSAEKSLKAFLVNNNIEPLKTHDLKLLCKMCHDINSAFSEITSQCAHLTPFGVATRYPDELSPDENMVKLAINKAQQVYDFCILKINETSCKS